MKILQVSNIISHHQLPLARELRKIVGDENFVFAAMQAPDQEREKLGWKVESSETWVINPSQNEEDNEFFEACWNNFDVVICGERLFDKMLSRVENGKLCFYMSERWWKPPLGKVRLLAPSFFKMASTFKKLSGNMFFHYLPIGPYAANDIKTVASPKLNIWDWGYFTSFHNLEVGSSNDGTLKILWAGRMLNWKKVDTIIKALSVLNNKDIDFKLTLIGEGPERHKLERLARNTLNKKNYEICDFLPADEVTKVMASHDVYVLASTEYEGWGAVVNEAMSVGNAVIASKSTGSAAAVIEDGIDGLLFDSGDWKKLANLLIRLASDREYTAELGDNARAKIEHLWAPQIAAARFVNVASSLIRGETTPLYEQGPMCRSWGVNDK
jgi:glycosyltransferase involved in cell wall biosynthesis